MIYWESPLVFEQGELVPIYRRILFGEHNFDPYAGPAEKIRDTAILTIIRNNQFIDFPTTRTVTIDNTPCRNAFDCVIRIQLFKKKILKKLILCLQHLIHKKKILKECSIRLRNVTGPIIKWAGGKRQLLAALEERLPERWDTYYEPFVGGGALFADLFKHDKLTHAVISDLNKELINLYSVIKTSPSELIDALADESLYSTEDSFNMLRMEFNDLVNMEENKVRRAALFIYLNKHGYNGLWRVNSSGGYNVPFGHCARKNLPSKDTIFQFSRMLANVKIRCTDFAVAVRTAQENDFVYFDPPYYPVSKTASFTEYHQNGFGFEEQKRLARTFKKLSDRGVQVMLSNSKTPEIEILYRDFTIATVPAKRMINCNGEGRHGALEIIVTNYKPPKYS